MGKPAATISHYHMCPDKTGNTPHVGGPIVAGAANVLIGGLPVALIGDKCLCVGPPDAIASGSASVTVNGKGIARLGDATVHGGKIMEGEPTVLVG